MAQLNSICIFLCFIYVSLFVISVAQTCSNYPFPRNRYYKFCVDLPHHHAHIHWTYYPITDEMAIAYRARLPIRGWIAWGINPTQSGMIGTQALVAFRNLTNGNVTAYTTPILSYSPNMLPGDLSLTVSSISAELRNNEIIISAVLGPLMFNTTTLNHVWQAGYLGSNGVPVMHAIALPNLQSFGQLDLLTWG